MKRLFPTIAMAVCFMTMTAQEATISDSEKVLVERVKKLKKMQKQIAERCWPDFAKPELTAPIIVYSDTACYLVNPKERLLNTHPSMRIYDNDYLLYRTALLDSIPFHMDTHCEVFDTNTFWGTTPYVRCSSLESIQKSSPDDSELSWLPMVLHEMAHGCQQMFSGFFKAKGTVNYLVHPLELMQYQQKDNWLNKLLCKENDHLLKALGAKDLKEQNKEIRLFLDVRKERKEKMTEELGADYVRLEEVHELAESLARYCEVQAYILLDIPGYTEDMEFFTQMNNGGYFFVTGYNLIRLFRKLGINLSTPYQAETVVPLEKILEANIRQALGDLPL